METKRLIEENERIHRRFLGHHLSAMEIAYSVLGCINITNESKWSFLHYSAYLGMERTCFKMLTNGADPNLANARGDTPIRFACKNGNYNCIEAILRFKPKMDIQNDVLYTLLYIFINKPPRNEYMLEKSLDADANPDIPDENGYSTFAH
ncbi:hypothetical protein WA026_006322 [Henosepilachna vigintioctopunctata]|uniref:Ankyrin repeat protein n=1 Tax=Henosepilachna vigintioctopunctata TaxID=420089 RepID=A0AAW1TI69_9CUCU